MDCIQCGTQINEDEETEDNDDEICERCEYEEKKYLGDLGPLPITQWRDADIYRYVADREGIKDINKKKEKKTRNANAIATDSPPLR